MATMHPRIPSCLTRSNTTSMQLPRHKPVLRHKRHTVSGRKYHNVEHNFRCGFESGPGGGHSFAFSIVLAATIASRDHFNSLAISLITDIVNMLEHLFGSIAPVVEYFVRRLVREVKKPLRGTSRAIDELLRRLTREAEKYHSKRIKTWRKLVVGRRLTEAVERFNEWYRNAVVQFPYFRFIDTSNRWWLMFTVGYLVVFLFAVVCMAARRYPSTA